MSLTGLQRALPPRDVRRVLTPRGQFCRCRFTVIIFNNVSQEIHRLENDKKRVLTASRSNSNMYRVTYCFCLFVTIIATIGELSVASVVEKKCDDDRKVNATSLQCPGLYIKRIDRSQTYVRDATKDTCKAEGDFDSSLTSCRWIVPQEFAANVACYSELKLARTRMLRSLWICRLC